MNKCCILVAAALSSVTTFGFNLQGDVHAQRVVWPGRSVLTFTQDGTLTVSGSGTVDLLMVGGGGGGGKASGAEAHRGGGGGGAGGVVYKKSFAVSEGCYSVVIGQGGAENANGGDTKLFDDAQVLNLIAHGGGGGANGETGKGKDGASGGGAAHPWSGSDVAAGGQAVFAADDNTGNAGGSSVQVYGAGGGGGAGAPATVYPSGDQRPMNGGDGLQYDICGTNVWYAGGGAGGSAWGVKANGGKGGGGKSGEAGAPGTGGGGGGGGDGHPAGSAGGSGILIVSFVPDVTADSDDFALTGGDQRVELSEDEVLVFTNSGPLSVSGSGCVEVLLVGGGGGGGNACSNPNDVAGGGGGAGGIVHLEDVVVSPGVYQVTVGAGGEPNLNGGNTIAFGGLIAYGGGGGGIGGYTADTAKNGASGGGATFRVEGSGTYSGGKAIYLESGNLGNDGGAASHMYGAGGGGGAGETPTVHANGGGASWPMVGGNGLSFDICGTSTWYAGGGAGGSAYGVKADGGKGGGGKSGAAGEPGTGGGGGGGGDGHPEGAKGGSGIVIVRYKRSTNLPNYAKEFSGAAGGAAVRRKGYMIHTFTADGQFTMPCDGYVEALLVGGGGGGGKALSSANDVAGGGGGAGGVFHVASCPLSAGTYSVKVGLGGSQGENGGETRLSDATKLFDLVAYGGGGGGTGGYTANTAKNGASGGGATFMIGGSGTYSGGKALYLASDIVGHDGGAASHQYGAGGGGGAGAPATVYPSGTDRPMNGGDGLQFDICGTNAWYAGGGAGGMAYGGKAKGGNGGGGASGVAGTPGTGGGGGGGGSGHPEGAPGGSGVLILRYKLPPSGMVLIFR